MECRGCSLRAWLRAAGLVPVCSTRTSYIVAGCSDVIHAVGTAEAFRALDIIFRQFDEASCCLIT
jgi:predicted phosphoribosyltransferase